MDLKEDNFSISYVNKNKGTYRRYRALEWSSSCVVHPVECGAHCMVLLLYEGRGWVAIKRKSLRRIR